MSLISGNSLSSFHGSSFNDTEIISSFRFRKELGSYLSRNFDNDGDGKKWTFSTWIKLACPSESSSQNILNYMDARSTTFIGFFGDRLYVHSNAISIAPGDRYPDRIAWRHLVVTVDTTEQSDGDRLKIFNNGKLAELNARVAPPSYPSLNADSLFNRAGILEIGHSFTGLLAETYFIDGFALNPDSFGKFKEGVWIAGNYDGDVGNNGFYLKYKDGNQIGRDYSGNDNHFVENNATPIDISIDTPTNNYCQLQPYLNNDSGTSLSYLSTCMKLAPSSSGSSSSSSGHIFGSMAIPKKNNWYFEVYVESLDVKVRDSVGVATQYLQHDTNAVKVIYSSNGVIYRSSDNYDTGHPWSVGDVIGVRVDLSRGAVTFTLNNVDVGGHVLEGSHEQFIPVFESSGSKLAVNFGQDSSFIGLTNRKGYTDINGMGDFHFIPKDRSLALCSINLPPGSVSPVSSIDNDGAFNTRRYVASGTGTVNVGMQPDIIWYRDVYSNGSFFVVDSVRGNSNTLLISSGYPEENTSKITAFNNDGFDYIDPDSKVYLFYCWKAGDKSVNYVTQEGLSVDVRVNEDTGLSIIKWLGDGKATYIKHGFNQTPDVLISKRTDQSGSWYIHTPIISDGANLQRLKFNPDPAIEETDFTNGSMVLPDKVNFPIIPDQNLLGGEYIAYGITSIEGFSKVSYYVGNGETDRYVYTGFRPAWILIDNASSVSSWFLMDRETWGFTTSGNYYRPNYDSSIKSESVADTGIIDFVSNGFHIRKAGSLYNEAGSKFFYVAFASLPLKFANPI